MSCGFFIGLIAALLVLARLLDLDDEMRAFRDVAPRGEDS